MVNNCGKPQSVNLVTQSSSQNIPCVRFEFRYFRFAIQFGRAPEFYGFRKLLLTSIANIEYWNRESMGLTYYSPNLFPVKRMS